MRHLKFSLILVVALCTVLIGLAEQVSAQQVTVGAPFNSVGDSFYEHMGTSWGGNFKGVDFSFGGGGLSTPQFGGYDANAGARMGVGFGGRGYSGQFNIFGGQGYRQNYVSQTPSVTLPQGVPGYFSDTSQTPFVISQIPVVGTGGPMIGSPMMPSLGSYSPSAAQRQTKLAQWQQQLASGSNNGMAAERPREVPRNVAPQAAPNRMPPPVMHQNQHQMRHQGAADGGDLMMGPGAAQPNRGGGFASRPATEPDRVAGAAMSSAGRTVPSVAEARRMHALESQAKNEEARLYIERGLTAEQQGKPGVAVIYYQMAEKRATDDWKIKIRDRIKRLQGNPEE